MLVIIVEKFVGRLFFDVGIVDYIKGFLGICFWVMMCLFWIFGLLREIVDVF